MKRRNYIHGDCRKIAIMERLDRSLSTGFSSIVGLATVQVVIIYHTPTGSALSKIL
ncbi:hypothetical protein T440DRAFT_313598 [Plenodomus tracheiphilus IPT5]|uniref:Uncharacterized protein n=1 Tax=Plenodomus tracheiphilus IPT5 TaxID=1408161 RepID=A0A6A7BE88_9PLEO|nr:hypothetical protein T440DRAFT_313598 [Plenodomus tracheiphilus IPT5]